MNVKLGTKAFAPQGAGERPTAANNAPSNLAAGELEKIGGENIGEALNKIADPNWVDPAKKMRTTGNDKLDKDSFFKLMIAQMKNQDPTNPLKPHEMSAQLANFSSLEQMQNINTTLNEMKAGQKPMEQFQALNLIGKAVAGDSAKVIRAKGDRDHEYRFSLPVDAAEASIRVRNADGEVVRTLNLKNLKSGDNKITWNGQDERGLNVQPGEYDFFMEAKGSNGQKLSVKTDFAGVITGVNYTAEGPVLLVGNQTVRLRDVKKITDPSLMSNDQKIDKSRDVTSQDLKNDGAVAQTDKEGNNGAAAQTATPSNAANGNAGAEAEATPKSKIMENVGLSRDMMAKLQKEMK